MKSFRENYKILH